MAVRPSPRLFPLPLHLWPAGFYSKGNLLLAHNIKTHNGKGRRWNSRSSIQWCVVSREAAQPFPALGIQKQCDGFGIAGGRRGGSRLIQESGEEAFLTDCPLGPRSIPSHFSLPSRCLSGSAALSGCRAPALWESLWRVCSQVKGQTESPPSLPWGWGRKSVSSFPGAQSRGRTSRCRKKQVPRGGKGQPKAGHRALLANLRPHLLPQPLALTTPGAAFAPAPLDRAAPYPILDPLSNPALLFLLGDLSPERHIPPPPDGPRLPGSFTPKAITRFFRGRRGAQDCGEGWRSLTGEVEVQGWLQARLAHRRLLSLQLGCGLAAAEDGRSSCCRRASCSSIIPMTPPRPPNPPGEARQSSPATGLRLLEWRGRPNPLHYGVQAAHQGIITLTPPPPASHNTLHRCFGLL